MPTADRPASAPGPAPTLLRAVGVLGLAASVFNIMVGGGIFRLPAGAAAAAGPSAPLVYLICAAVMGLVGLCFAEAGSRVPLTGGPYAYVELVFGRYVGFLAGVLLWMLGTTAVAGVSSAFAEALAALIGRPSLRVPILVLALGLLTAINRRGVEQGTRLIGIVSVAKLLPLLLFIAVGAFAVVPANLAIAEVPSGGAMARAAIVLLFAFSGVETALVPSGEVKDPARTVPRGIAIAMIGVTALYLGVHLVAAGILGPALATETVAPLAVAAGRVAGEPGRTLLLVGAVISMFGYVSGMTLAVPRALWAFARDGLLPRAIGAVHPVYRTPHVAIVVQTGLVLLLAVLNSFEALAVLSNLAALLLYIGCAAATLVLRQRGVREPGSTPFAVPGGPVVPVVTIALIGWLLTSITRAEWTVLGATLVVATGFYAINARRGPAAASAA